jgi:hypothetical protein
MALVLEDGTGVTTANAYVDTAFVTAYLTAKGDEFWADQDTLTKESAIVRATFAMDGKYGQSFIGIKGSQAQALQWPRVKALDSTEGVTDADGYVVDPATIPTILKNIVSEIALIELTERFLVHATTRDDMVTLEKVGPLTTEWAEGAPTVTYYPHIDSMMLASGLGTSSAGINMFIGLTAEEINQGYSNDPFDYPEYFNLIKVP